MQRRKLVQSLPSFCRSFTCTRILELEGDNKTGISLGASSSSSEDRTLVKLREEIDGLGRRSIQADSNTYGSLLRQCASARAQVEGKLLHSHIVKSGYEHDTFLENLLVQMYGNCGQLGDARLVFERIRQKNEFSWNVMIAAYVQNRHMQEARITFEEMPRRNVVSWTTMIAAYAQNGDYKDALEHFRLMDVHGVQPDKVAFSCILDACANMAALAEGKALLDDIVHKGFLADVVVGTSLLNMYGKCGSLNDARTAFEKMPKRNVVSWTAMVEASAHNGHLQEARIVFHKMPYWNAVSWATMIGAYANAGDLQEAQNLLDQMPHRSVVAWTILISANAHAGNVQEALRLFQQMDLEGIHPDKVILVSVLDACAKYAALVEGKLIQGGILDTGFMMDAAIVTALINLHGKCGSLEDAKSMLGALSLHTDVVLWTAMMAAYAHNGHGSEALELFHLMGLDGVEPNNVTFTIVLFVCSHAGLLRDAWGYFVSMRTDHGLKPTLDHYVSMMDLLGRAGQINQARDLIENMPFLPDDVAWTILLNACKLYGDSDRGAYAAEHLLKLDVVDSSPYVLLSNVCAAS